MRYLLALAMILLLWSCTKPQPAPPKTEMYYDLEFQGQSNVYPARVQWTIGSQVYTDTIKAAFDTTITHVKGGVKASMLTAEYMGRTARLKSVIIYGADQSVSHLYTFTDSAYVEVQLPEYQ